MKWHEKIIAAHLEITDAVSHAERLESERYFVWQEMGANDLTANNRTCRKGNDGGYRFIYKARI